MKLLKIDEQGFFIEDVIVEKIPVIELDGELVEDPLYIKENCPNGFYRPKWEFTNNQWIEGASQEVINQIDQEKQESEEQRILEEQKKKSIEEAPLKIQQLEEENVNLMLASAETYEVMYQENVNLMLAVAEIYETMNGGAV